LSYAANNVKITNVYRRVFLICLGATAGITEIIKICIASLICIPYKTETKNENPNETWQCPALTEAISKLLIYKHPAYFYKPIKVQSF